MSAVSQTAPARAGSAQHGVRVPIRRRPRPHPQQDAIEKAIESSDYQQNDACGVVAKEGPRSMAECAMPQAQAEATATHGAWPPPLVLRPHCCLDSLLQPLAGQVALTPEALALLHITRQEAQAFLELQAFWDDEVGESQGAAYTGSAAPPLLQGALVLVDTGEGGVQPRVRRVLGSRQEAGAAGAGAAATLAQSALLELEGGPSVALSQLSACALARHKRAVLQAALCEHAWQVERGQLQPLRRADVLATAHRLRRHKAAEGLAKLAQATGQVIRAQHTAGALWDPRMLLELQQVMLEASSCLQEPVCAGLVDAAAALPSLSSHTYVTAVLSHEATLKAGQADLASGLLQAHLQLQQVQAPGESVPGSPCDSMQQRQNVQEQARQAPIPAAHAPAAANEQQQEGRPVRRGAQVEAQAHGTMPHQPQSEPGGEPGPLRRSRERSRSTSRERRRDRDRASARRSSPARHRGRSRSRSRSRERWGSAGALRSRSRSPAHGQQRSEAGRAQRAHDGSRSPALEQQARVEGKPGGKSRAKPEHVGQQDQQEQRLSQQELQGPQQGPGPDLGQLQHLQQDPPHTHRQILASTEQDLRRRAQGGDLMSRLEQMAHELYPEERGGPWQDMYREVLLFCCSEGAFSFSSKASSNCSAEPAIVRPGVVFKRLNPDYGRCARPVPLQAFKVVTGQPLWVMQLVEWGQRGPLAYVQRGLQVDLSKLAEAYAKHRCRRLAALAAPGQAAAGSPEGPQPQEVRAGSSAEHDGEGASHEPSPPAKRLKVGTEEQQHGAARHLRQQAPRSASPPPSSDPTAARKAAGDAGPGDLPPGFAPPAQSLGAGQGREREGSRRGRSPAPQEQQQQQPQQEVEVEEVLAGLRARYETVKERGDRGALQCIVKELEHMAHVAYRHVLSRRGGAVGVSDRDVLWAELVVAAAAHWEPRGGGREDLEGHDMTNMKLYNKVKQFTSLPAGVLEKLVKGKDRWLSQLCEERAARGDRVLRYSEESVGQKRYMLARLSVPDLAAAYVRVRAGGQGRR